MITKLECDNILLAEWDGQSKNNVYVPRGCRPLPPKLKPYNPNVFVDFDWVQAAHKYTISFELICHCLEICGLRKLSVSLEIEFNLLCIQTDLNKK